jgi:diguanylate cyclase (GGDEF)-like protein
MVISQKLLNKKELNCSVKKTYPQNEGKLEQIEPKKNKTKYSMLSKLKQQLKKWQEVLICSSCITVSTLVATATGLFQSAELATFDQFLRLRPAESSDQRIVIVSIDEEDLNNYGFPLTDQKLAQALNHIKQQEPRVIGLDLYRNLPREPGYQDLVTLFNSSDNLIGVEKVIGKQVAPPHTLPPEQVSISDLVVDYDNKVRRSLLSVEREDGRVQLGLGSLVALDYLADEGIYLEPAAEGESYNYKLGKSLIKPFSPNDGGYVRADAGGYQILLNYRGLQDKFSSYSFSDVVEGKIPSNWAKDRIVLIGAVAESLNDRFFTPFSHDSLRNSSHPTAGVIIHANIASQLLAAALDGRKLIQVVPEYLEGVWLFCWCLIGAVVSSQFIEKKIVKNSAVFWLSLFSISIIIPLLGLASLSYLLFLAGWWIPVITPLVGLSLSALTIPSYKHYLLSQVASVDSLTKVPNRRYFDEFYHNLWNNFTDTAKPISLILCDVDHFKLYNDYYGHQAGDKCLYQVAQAIDKAIRSTDLLARYGGEEFVVVLPDTDPEIALKIGERICQQIQSLQIPHAKSLVSNIVTLSGGLATAYPDNGSSASDLIEEADRSLYQAKAQGRNRVVNLGEQ